MGLLSRGLGLGERCSGRPLGCSKAHPQPLASGFALQATPPGPAFRDGQPWWSPCSACLA